MDYLFPYREEAWPKAKEAETAATVLRRNRVPLVALHGSGLL